MTTTSTEISSLLARVRAATPLVGHDGRSGARIERAVLDDGSTVVIKRTRYEDDLVMRVTDDAAGREAVLWADGVLDRLPPGVSHPVLAAGWQGDELVTVMRDLGERVTGWDATLTAADLARVFDAVSLVHRTFTDHAPRGVCDLTTRLTMLGPERVARLAGHPNPLPRIILRGWDHFTEQVPAPVADAVLAAHRDPSRLAQILASSPRTLLHGDLTMVNVAWTEPGVTLLDWSLATAGPAVLDFVCFLVTSGSGVQASYGDQVELVRTACGPWHDETVLRAALFWGLLELGWNLALNAVEHPDPAERAIARRDLAWWTDRADEALEAGVVG